MNETLLGFGVEDSLTCQAEGFPQPRVTFLHLERNFTSQEVANGDEKIVYPIAEVSKDNAGRYQCIAENLFGKVSMVTTVLVVGQSKWFKSLGQPSLTNPPGVKMKQTHDKNNWKGFSK